MEVSSGEEYYIASDNTGTPLAVFSSNGQMIKQVTVTPGMACFIHVLFQGRGGSAHTLECRLSSNRV